MLFARTAQRLRVWVEISWSTSSGHQWVYTLFRPWVSVSCVHSPSLSVDVDRCLRPVVWDVPARWYPLEEIVSRLDVPRLALVTRWRCCLRR
jgi:hypothetical protein